jgi:hypothetical protein
MIKEFQNFKYLSDYISEEIDLGHSKTFPIKKRLYKSGDYICSSFQIDCNREVIVSSISIPSSEIKLVNNSRNYKTISDYIKQFKINTDNLLYVGFMEYKGGKYNEDENVNDLKTLFSKMQTIISIIKDFTEYHNIKYLIFKSVDNDPSSGIIVDYNKRDKFYELFLAYHDIKYYKIKHSININGEIISDFYLIDLN